MPEPKQTSKSRRARPRVGRRNVAEPPIIVTIPFHKEAYYAGVGLIDWSSERVGRFPAKLRRLEKELVARGQKRNVVLMEQFGAAREDLTRRGRDFQSRAQRKVQDIWAALRGTPRGEPAGSHATPGAV